MQRIVELEGFDNLIVLTDTLLERFEISGGRFSWKHF